MQARVSRWAGYADLGANTLDVGRGLAIMSVIYGHALAPWFAGASAHFSEGAFLQWKFGAAFMMVFFFFLSGAGWREDRSLETTFRQAGALVLIAWLASVMLDLVLWGLTVGGLAPAMVQAPLSLLDVVRNAARMAAYGHDYSMSALWFLTAMAVVRVLAAISLRVGARASWLLAAILLVATFASVEMGWRNFYQLNLIGVAFVAFLCGHALSGAIRDLERWPHAAFALLVIAGGVTIGTFALNQGCTWDVAARCGRGWINDRFGVSMIVGQFGNIPLFALTAAAGVAFATALSVLLARFGSLAGRRFAVWGRASMDLLIVNCLVLEVLNPVLSLWVAPQVAADHALFFVTLFAVALALNLALAALLKRSLRRLRAAAARIAGWIVGFGLQLHLLATGRRLRVSQGHD